VAHKTVTLGVRGIDMAQPESETMVGVTGLAEGSTVLKSNVGALREGMVVKYTATAASSPVTSPSTSSVASPAASVASSAP
jgi:hypothetical protein